jgi:hypothetical protein
VAGWRAEVGSGRHQRMAGFGDGLRTMGWLSWFF